MMRTTDQTQSLEETIEWRLWLGYILSSPKSANDSNLSCYGLGDHANTQHSWQAYRTTRVVRR